MKLDRFSQLLLGHQALSHGGPCLRDDGRWRAGAISPVFLAVSDLLDPGYPELGVALGDYGDSRGRDLTAKMYKTRERVNVSFRRLRARQPVLDGRHGGICDLLAMELWHDYSAVCQRAAATGPGIFRRARIYRSEYLNT